MCRLVPSALSPAVGGACGGVPRAWCERSDWRRGEVRGNQEARDRADDWLPAGNSEREREREGERH